VPAASSTAPSRSSPSTTSASPTPPRSYRSPASAPSASHTPAPGAGGGRRDRLRDHQPPLRGGPSCLADLLRGHWAIEAVHHLRDVTFAEDGCQVRTGAGPPVMACLRNLVTGCSAGPGRSTSPRRAAPPRPRPCPSSSHPGHHPGSSTHEQTSRENAGALAPLLTRARSS
jgi:hypothetical protein